MLPCPNYPGRGAPCPLWDANLLNKVLLPDHPICVACHLLREKKLARQYVDAEREFVKYRRPEDGTAKEVWEARLRNGVRMQAEIYRLDAEIGREGAWREEGDGFVG